ncbi:MAG: hypothetical protein DMD48_14880 [Gemmatimonadetes bacterium]|nr:MAG: hypothetical protein DMD48_14880 [Gemmatimonadota bacterium]
MADVASLDRLKAALDERYRIERTLGAGGMATVYLARDVKHDRDVALKVLRPELAAVLGADRFLAEIRITAALDHPHILTLIDSGETDRFLWYVLPYVRGESLRDRLNREGQLPLEDALTIARHIAGALEYAHRQGVIHRDIKPENILLFEGEAMLTDFGIALAVGVAAGTRLTESGLSLGIIAKLLADRPTSLRTLRDTVPEVVEAAVAKALAKAPADRFMKASHFVDALGRERNAVAPALLAAPRLRSRRWFLAAAVGLIALTAVWWQLTPSGRPSATPQHMSIAVMPLTNLSGDPSNDYFGAGLAEEMTGALAKAGLQVIGRTSARALASRGLDAREVARQLRVASVLEGSVRRDGDRVRVSVTLSSGVDGSITWNEQYERRLQDIFAIQAEIARTVATQLRATLADESRVSLVRQETTDPEAHSLYLQGLYLWNRRNAPSVHRAVGLFEEAVKRDPGYARAYAGIALAKAVLPFYEDVDTDEVVEEAREAARRALAIDSTLTEAWAVQGLMNACLWKNTESERDFNRAIALDSTAATARFWYGLHLTHLGRFAEAHRQLARAGELEPVSPVIRIGPILLLINQRRYREAEAMVRQLLDDDPTFGLAAFHLGAVLADAGRFDEAVSTLSTMLELPSVRASEVQSTLAYALTRGGRTVEAQRVIGVLRASKGGRLPPSAVLAAALMALGEREVALDVLQAAVEQHDPMIVIHGRSARLDGLRTDPRGRALLAITEAQ